MAGAAVADVIVSAIATVAAVAFALGVLVGGGAVWWLT